MGECKQMQVDTEEVCSARIGHPGLFTVSVILTIIKLSKYSIWFYLFNFYYNSNYSLVPSLVYQTHKMDKTSFTL